LFIIHLIVISLGGTKIFVGVSKHYARREDVMVQTRLANDTIAVAESLEEMAQQIEVCFLSFRSLF
jgi:hypothetical protein